ncbi:MAG: efflux RND transporter permease subunit, partial [Odoribacter sp.]|nr:efflux RND transporter permease subunit [Odoribacter sp.]
MNIAKYALDNPKVIYFFLAVMLVGGVFSFGSLGKKEDSPFVIKTAVLMTQYPGASPREVEELITEPIEREIQSMRRVYKIKSDSYYGMSKISVELDPATPPDEIPQMWDELRRKVLNIQSQLPQGVSDIKVSDDFGDVFGIYFALTADDGFSYHDLREWGQRLKTDLVTIEGVQKVTLFGEQTEVVNVFISMSKLAHSGINLNAVMQTIKSQNALINTGEKKAGNMQLKVLAEGTYKNLTDIRNQLISTKNGEQIHLGDIAVVEKGYQEPPGTLIKVNGKKAIRFDSNTFYRSSFPLPST